MLLAACTVADPSYVGETSSSGSFDETTTRAGSSTTQPIGDSSTGADGGADATTTGSSVSEDTTTGQTSSEVTATDSSGSSTGVDGESSTTASPGCMSDGDCAATPETPACDVGTGECVQCIVPSHCPVAAAACVDQQCTSYGQPCTRVNECDMAAGESCCGANQCENSCMIPCKNQVECPPATGCAHGFCLPVCADTNDDCTGFPTFTCQHPVDGANTLCEND